MTGRPGSPSFGSLLRRFRRAAGLTQEELAERAGVSARAISDLERGENRLPRQDTFDLLVEALDLSAEDHASLRDLLRGARVEALPPSGPDSPPARAGARHATALPVHLTPFIGRAREIEAVCRRMMDPETRLLTLTGPGGVGKTRLAVQVARTVEEAFADGIHFVSLAAVTDEGLVLSAIAQALAVADAPGALLGETLAASIGEKSLLLLLDSFDQVLLASSALVVLLERCPHTKVVVTSRAALRVQGERVYLVPPLDTPALATPLDLETLARYEAVGLFLSRAQDVQPDFALTAGNAAAVVEICHRLDGLPLAIELAAARVRLFSPGDLRDRLGSRLELLSGGPRDLPPRQRTLRATLDWSFHLLDGDEQGLFARLAVFQGGWTFEAAESVCAVGDGASLGVLDGIASLLDNSLLRREAGDGGEPRVGMLETIHDYAREQLERYEAAELRRRHAAYYLALAERVAPELMGSAQSTWVARLDQDHDNLRAALQWTATGDYPDWGLRLAGALWRFWYIRGYLSEGRVWIERALARAGDDEGMDAAAYRARAFHGASVLAWAQGDDARAAVLAAQALALCRDQGDTAGIAGALNVLGLLAIDQDEPERAARLLDECLALRRQLGDQWGVAITLNNLGIVARREGAHARATELHRESLALQRSIGDTGGSALSLANLGLLACLQGDYPEAAALYRESLVAYGTIGDLNGVATCLEGLAAVAVGLNDTVRAARLFGAAGVLRRDHGLAGGRVHQASATEALTALWSEVRPRERVIVPEGLPITLDEAVAMGLEESEEALSRRS